VNKHLYLCHPLVLSSPTLMMHGHTNLKFERHCLSEQSARPKAVEDDYYSCHRRSKWRNAKKRCEEHGETCR